MKKKRKRKKKLLLTLFACMFIIALGATAFYATYIYKYNQNWNNLIYPGVIVEGIDIGGKTVEDAVNYLESNHGDIVLNKKIFIKTSKKTYTIDYSKLNARHNIDEIVKQAFNYGKDLSMIEKYKLLKSNTLKEYKLQFTYDDKYVEDIIKSMEKEINKNPIDAKLDMVSTGKFKVTPDVLGYKLQSDKIKKEILDNINGELGGDITLNAPIETLVAAKTADKLSKVNTLISSFSTSFKTSTPGRVNNIELATKAINGRVLVPGESFSFNDTVGERTEARGYQEAGVIIGNKVESGLGGGICQVSSTLYNAMLRANMDQSKTKRIHHSLPSSYVPLGLDATVDWGRLDYKFTNTLEYPIYIDGYVEDKVLYFNVYSNSALASRSYDITNEVYETINATTETINDSSLPKGVKKIEQKASNGYRVRVYRNTYENGKLIKKDLLYKDYYKPVNGTIRIGTKK